MGKMFFSFTAARILAMAICLSMMMSSFAQSVTQKLEQAYQQFETDVQLKYAISSLYVMDAKTGKVIFDKNSKIGLAPASTQKIITSATAFELLGRDFRYKTKFAINRQGVDGKPWEVTLIIKPSGDPTLGSWRWENTREENVIARIRKAVKRLGITKFYSVEIDGTGWSFENNTPDGWIWQDIGNYYGAGSRPLNWRENQYDIVLQSTSRVGDPVKLVETKPGLYDQKIISYVVAGEKGTGDNAYVYASEQPQTRIIEGSIPINENHFVISAAMPLVNEQFVYRLFDSLAKTRISGIEKIRTVPVSVVKKMDWTNNDKTVIHEEVSPALDSIVYWFLKKSINLYGEALIKTLSFEKYGQAVTDSGVAIVRNFWKQKGIDEDELNMRDGSGLSPLNRVTTHAQVEILKYAKTRDWFPYFYEAFPEYNGMKVKSGTISDVKGFCGYHKAADGNEYIFSFLVNNYSGRSSALVNKMYKVMDVLK
jgi:D-alanyl-D-alanine carboxypeptidase/D-alanyl-D-alanine-endopeptidase (penicillin-binding protein 4)